MKSWSLSPSLHEGLRTETQGFLRTLGKQWWNAGLGHESTSQEMRKSTSPPPLCLYNIHISHNFYNN